MRVASFNILHGRSPADDRVDPDRLTEAVRALDPDVLALQEVDRDQPRSGGVDLTAVAAEAMGARDYRFVPALIGTPGSGWRPASGDRPGNGPAYGVALLTRVPAEAWHVVRLPGRPLSRPPDEPRVGIVAELPGLTVITTHLTFRAAWNSAQMRRLVGVVRRMPMPQLLLGDLNTHGKLPRCVRDWTALVDAPTFPAQSPTYQLDHVLARGFSPAVSRVEVVQHELSDHRSVTVEWEGPP